RAGGRGADRRHLRAGLSAAFAAVPLAEPPARVEGDGRPARRGAREEDGGEGPKVLCFGGGWGYRNVMSNKRPIKSPADKKGVTIPVQQSPVYIGMMKQLGANPVPMPWSEVFLALKQGTVDAMEAAAVSIVSDKYHEIGKYYSLTKHTYEPITWFTNLRNYSALPADLKKALDAASKDACALDRKAELDSEAGDLETIRKAGVQVNDIADTKPFRDMMGPVYQEVGAKVGKEWLDKVLDAAK